MRIILTTLYDENMRDIGRVCHRSLTRLFGSNPDFKIVVYESLLDASLAPSWNKILAARVLLPNADWLMWLDADCVVHRDPNLAQYTETASDFRPAQDYNGVNCGIFMIRNCPWSMRFLDTLLFLGDVADDKAFGRHDGCKWEQNAVKLLRQSFKSVAGRIEPLPQELVSDTTSGFKRDRFIHHAYAMNNGSRIELLSRILDQAQTAQTDGHNVLR
jgi:hypothetical protein